MASTPGTILLTGANGGLGTAIAKSIITDPKLATYHGVYTVRETATAAVQSTLEASKSHQHDVVQLDLSAPSNVREVASRINARVAAGEIPRIQALILNAGYREPQGQKRTPEGLDSAFAGNYLGHWLLVLLLLRSLDRDSGRIVVVGSSVHDGHDPANKMSGAFVEEKWKTFFANSDRDTVDSIAKGTWSLSPDDPAQDPRGLSGIRRLGASKLCITMMIFELQRRLDSDPHLSGISVLGVDPGMMPTKITTGTLNLVVRSIFHMVMYISSWISPNGIFRMTDKSARDVLGAALQTGKPFGERPKGLYLNGSEPKEASVEAQDVDKRTAVWKASVEYAELKEGETSLAEWE